MLICSQEEKILYTHTYTQPSKCRLHLNISKEFLSLWLFVEWEKKIQFHSHYNIKDHHHHIFNSNHLLNWKNCFPFLVSCFIVWSGKKWQNNTSNNFQKKKKNIHGHCHHFVFFLPLDSLGGKLWINMLLSPLSLSLLIT